MAFKRALWKSGLIYEQTCDACKTTFRYMDDKLDFRPWYADGFVYCPNCRRPVRHNELHAVATADGQPIPNTTAVVGQPVEPSVAPSFAEPTPAPVAAPVAEPAGALAKFCSECGTPFQEGERFCSQCGKKR